MLHFRLVFIFDVLFGKMRLKSVLFLCCVLLYGTAFSQTNKRAKHHYRSALQNWSQWHKSAAMKQMNRSIKKDKKSPDAYSQLGQWYFQQQRFQEAAKIFTEASLNCPNGKRYFAKPLTKSLLYAGMPDSALRVINAYATVKDSAVWNNMRHQAWFIQNAYRNMHPEWPVNLGMRINSRYPELFPCFTTDTATIYFTRKVNNMDEDIFVAHQDICGEWLRADNLGTPPNTPSHEDAQFISADGHYVFFSRSDNRSENGWAEGGYDLFMAYRIAIDSDWSTPQPFGGTINTPAYEGMPTLTADNRSLYFVSDRPGGYGGLDIWVTKFENGLWQLPVNAGPVINTAGDETTPFIGLDNKTLFFSSNGHLGMGGMDLFVCRKVNDSTWSTPVNMGYPINTASNEQSICLLPSGKKMFFASDRQGPAGNYDIYETSLDMSLQPSPVSFLQGYVYDSVSKEKLNFAAIYIMDANNGDTLYTVQSNRGDASFQLPLAANKTYAMYVAHVGHTEVNDTFTFDKQYLSTPFVRNVPMLSYDYKEPIFDSLLATIHFNINKVDLSDSDMLMITKGIEPFLLERGYMVYVNGYTDNTGTPMLNEELSTKRALQVAKMLTNLGIDESSIIAKGWGEANMIAPNDTEEGQKKNRRVEIRMRR